MTSIQYNIPRISCDHCVRTIQTELAALPGVQAVEGNADGKTVRVEFDPPATDEGLRKALAEISYPVQDA